MKTPRAPGTPKKAIARWTGIAERYCWPLVVGITAATAFAAYVASDLRLETDLARLLPEDAPSVVALDEIEKKVGAIRSVRILIQSPDSAANDSFARELLPRLLAMEYYGDVEYRRDMSYFEDRKLLYLSARDLEEVRRRIHRKARYEANKADPLFFLDEPDPGLDFSDIEERVEREYRSSELIQDERTGGGTSIIVRAYPDGREEQVGRSRRMLADTRALVDDMSPASYHPEMDVVLGGRYVNNMVEFNAIKRDITSSAAIAVLLIVLIITIYFRQGFAWLFVGLPIFAGVTWCFGITAVTIGNLNLVTGFLAAVLAGLGIDFGVHAFARYVENRNGGHSPVDAMRGALEKTGSALTTTALTTAAAFYALMITNFRGFSEFGFIAATGIVLSLAAVFVAFPPFVFAGERLGIVRHTAIRHRGDDRRRARFPLPRTVLVVTGLILVASVLLLPHLAFEYDFRKLRAELPEHSALKDRFSAVAPPEAGNPAAIVVEDPVERRELVRALEDLAAREGSTIRGVTSIETVVPDSQAQKLEILASIRRLVRRRLDNVVSGSAYSADQLARMLDPPDTVRAADLPEFVMRRFRGSDGSVGEFVAIYPGVGLVYGDLVMQFADEIRTVSAGGKTYHASGTAIIFADMLELMIDDSSMAVGVTTAVIFLILLAQFRCLWRAVIVLFPVAGGVLAMCGVMVALGMKLNFYNMVVLPAILGIGVDSGVHLYHRYREEGPGSVVFVLRNTGGPVLVAILTTMVGFGGMLFAVHQGLNSIGRLAMVGLLSCMFMALVALPALLQVLEERKSHTPEA